MNGVHLALIAFAAFAAVAYVKRDELAILATDLRELIKGFEGFSPTAYVDDNKSTPDRVEYSIGYGHQITGKETTNDPEDLLDQDIAMAGATVDRYVKVPLTEGQRTALVSLVFNIGAGNFAKSTLLQLLNAGEYHAAAQQFDRWIYAGGVVVPELKRRRAKEKEIFLA